MYYSEKYFVTNHETVSCNDALTIICLCCFHCLLHCTQYAVSFKLHTKPFKLNYTYKTKTLEQLIHTEYDA